MLLLFTIACFTSPQIEEVATALSLPFSVDAAGNILVRKPASPGFESSVRIAVQSHIDMVTSKTMDSTHCFDTDPILADVTADGQWVQAAGTTLGADDGIGVAAALALLEADASVVAHGPLECLFTVEEETTMGGALNLAPAPFLTAQALLNVDSEEDHCVCVGCAGGMESKLFMPLARVATTYKTAAAAGKLGAVTVDAHTTAATATAAATAAFAVPAAAAETDAVALTLALSGFAGGHTGVDAASARANAIQVMARLIGEATEAYTASVSSGASGNGLGLASFSGGNAPNAIPRDATATLVVPAAAAASVAAAAAALFTGIVTESLLPEAKAKLGEASAGLYGAQSTAGMEAKALASEPAKARALCGMTLQLTAAPLEPVAAAAAAAPPTAAESAGLLCPLTTECTARAAALVQSIPHGVIRYSPEVAGDVDTSNALSIVLLTPTPAAAAAAAAAEEAAAASRHGTTDEADPEGDYFMIHCFYRSFSDFQLHETARRLRALATLAGAKISKPFAYFNGWEPAMSSPLLASVLSSHKELFPALPAPQVYSVHAGLECGPIKSVYPDIHAVSIGPLSTCR